MLRFAAVERIGKKAQVKELKKEFDSVPLWVPQYKEEKKA